MRILCWWPEQSPNCLQLPVLCSHSKVSPSLTCLSRFPALPVHLPSPPLLRPLLLAAKSSWNFLLRLQKFRLLLFSLLPQHLLFLRLFAWAVGSAIPHSPIPLSIHSTACHVSFMFVCLSYDMRHMKYGGYDIRNMSSLNFPQCYCYSSQPPDTFPFTFPVPFLSHNFSFISFISLPTLFALYSDFRLCKWIL